MRNAIKQGLSPDLNPLDYATQGILQNITNATPHPNISSFKTAIGRNGIKCLKNLFQRHVDTIIEKNGGHIE